MGQEGAARSFHICSEHSRSSTKLEPGIVSLHAVGQKMELNSGDDLISLKESILSHHSPSTGSPPSFADADEYARCSGLTIDSRSLDWRQLVERDPALASTILELEAGQLIETVQLKECLFRAIIPTPEQWQIPAASLQILQDVCTRRKDEDLAGLVSEQCFPETLKWKGLKLEAPALRSDHGADCRRLMRRVKAFLKEPLPEHRLPLHPVDVGKGEGLEFPESLTQQEKAHMKTIEHENLEVTRDTLAYLMQSLRSDLTDNARRDFARENCAYEGVGAAEHLTPPLSPLLLSSPEYFVPEEEICEIPEPSGSSSVLSEDITASEQKIFETDLGFWAEALEREEAPERYDDIDMSEMIRAGEFRSPALPSSSQPVSRDMRIDVPLLPWSDENAEATETTRILASDDLAEAKELVVSSDTLSGSDGPTGQLVTLFLEKATHVMRCAEQERLQPLDATARVPVPVLDFSAPAAEWEQRPWEAKAMFRWIQKDTDVDWQHPKWTHNRASEQRMVWAPLAHMTEKRLVSEQIEVDPKAFEFFLERSRDCEVPSSADYVYKQPGLAVLRIEDDGDDEDFLTPLGSSRPARPTGCHAGSLEGTALPLIKTAIPTHCNSPKTIPRPTPPPADLMTLLTGRKRAIDETLGKRQAAPALIPSTNVLRGFMSEYPDFAPLVDNFVEMNFPKKQKLTHSAFFVPPVTKPPFARSKEEEAAKLMPPPPKPVPALAPDITPPALPPRIVVSSTTSKLITLQLEKLLPGIDLITRDYDKHRPSSWVPGMRTPNLDEADIVVSPATGILLTTMIMLRQKALPGQTIGNHSISFCRIVENVAVRYERLVVLVSEGNKHSETASPLSQSDARALAEFQGFSAGLQTADVQSLYVGGGVETLAKWAAAKICEYANEAVAVRDMLLPIETFWEVFLRRAGMNAYAAQVVLGRLKVPDDRPAVGEGRGQVFGLPLLFEDLFGGTKVLERTLLRTLKNTAARKAASRFLTSGFGQHQFIQYRLHPKYLLHLSTGR
ncbi:uncharacterized protein B0T15DRAFT_510611 [Chaetomium strumarium]|uniref:Uncharacterized protein n=1 Tax=Chaetomium strumarium TaxID=1170767 RepID=A0AAJ0GWB2_9PEZI|nr:hypothetical protein B0T15DRAFT_510611 [Chaetomium strumarium]